MLNFYLYTIVLKCLWHENKKGFAVTLLTTNNQPPFNKGEEPLNTPWPVTLEAGQLIYSLNYHNKNLREGKILKLGWNLLLFFFYFHKFATF